VAIVASAASGIGLGVVTGAALSLDLGWNGALS